MTCIAVCVTRVVALTRVSAPVLQIGCADGATRLMYHPKKSKNGALISNARAPKR